MIPNPFEVLSQRLDTIQDLLIELKHGPAVPALTSPPDSRPLTKKEAAKYLGCSINTLTNRENEGLVKGFRSGAKRLYRREDLDASLKPVRRTAA